MKPLDSPTVPNKPESPKQSEQPERSKGSKINSTCNVEGENGQQIDHSEEAEHKAPLLLGYQDSQEVLCRKDTNGYDLDGIERVSCLGS